MKSSYRAGLLVAVIAACLPYVALAQIANEPWEQDGVAPISPIGLNQGYGFGSPSWGGAWGSAITPPTSILIPAISRLHVINDADADGLVELGSGGNDQDFLIYVSPDTDPSPASNSFTIASGTRILRVEGAGAINNQQILRRNLAASVGDDSISFAYLFRVQDGLINQDDGIGWWLDDGDADLDNAAFFGIDVQANGGGDFFVDLNDGLDRDFVPGTVLDLNPAGNDPGPSATYYIVVRMSKIDGEYRDIRMWVNPDGSDNFTTADAIKTVAAGSLVPSTISQVGMFAISTDNVAGNRDVYYFDGPRMGGFPDVVPPGGTTLLVDLASLTATREGGAVTIAWETLSELDTAGFKVVRANADGTLGQEITATLVPGEGSGNAGASYSVVDSTPTNPASYFLVEIELDGDQYVHGPITATGSSPSSSVGDWTMY